MGNLKNLGLHLRAVIPQYDGPAGILAPFFLKVGTEESSMASELYPNSNCSVVSLGAWKHCARLTLPWNERAQRYQRFVELNVTRGKRFRMHP